MPELSNSGRRTSAGLRRSFQRADSMAFLKKNPWVLPVTLLVIVVAIGVVTT